MKTSVTVAGAWLHAGWIIGANSCVGFFFGFCCVFFQPASLPRPSKFRGILFPSRFLSEYILAFFFRRQIVPEKLESEF